MRTFLIALALTLAVVSAKPVGGVVDVDTKIDTETAQILLKTVEFLNAQNPALSVSLDAVPELLKRTSQVVNGLKKSFTFKFASNLYYVEVWDAPWMGANNKITKSCILASPSCTTGDACLALAVSKGTCNNY